MKIFILRHGQAEAYQTSDAVRRLTEKGVADTQQMLSSNLQFLSSVKNICASPLVRAKQTAAIAAQLLKVESLITTSCLEPEANLQDVFSFLESFSETEILLVSHLPLVGILANRLCGFTQNRIQFNTSSLVGIECDFATEGLGNLFLEKHV
jgi:phosphohistidine phosphatase